MTYKITFMSFYSNCHLCLGDNKPNSSLLTSRLFLLVSLFMVLLLTGCEQTEDVDPKPETAINKDTSTTLNIASPDWGNAATLTAMGYPPIATGDIRVWDQWVRDPKLPDSVVDLGIRYQPNVELVAQLPVDMVVDNFFYQHARSLYGEGVAAESITFAAKDKIAKWSDYSEPTRKLGAVINEPQLAEAYIADSRKEIIEAGKVLQQHYPEVDKYAVVQFVDSNNLRMYVANSLFQPGLDEMGKQLVSLAEGNKWGFISITLADLAKLDTEVCLLVVQPLSPLTKAEIKNSLIWQRLDYGNSRCYGELPPIWIYGGMSSLVTLANSLSEASLQGGAAL